MGKTWQSEARIAVRAYPYLKKDLERIRQTRVTSAWDSVRVQTGDRAYRPVEIASSIELPRGQMRKLRAVEKTFSLIQTLPNGNERVRLAELLYFSDRFTLEGASQRLHISVGTASNWNHEFLLLVFAQLKNPRNYSS